VARARGQTLAILSATLWQSDEDGQLAGLHNLGESRGTCTRPFSGGVGVAHAKHGTMWHRFTAILHVFLWAKGSDELGFVPVLLRAPTASSQWLMFSRFARS